MIKQCVVLLLLPTLFYTGCGNWKRTSRKTAVMVLFDVSGSTSGMRRRYFDEFDRTVSSLKNGEMLIGDIITENTVATASYPIRETFPVYNSFVDNPLTYKKKVKQIQTKVLDKAKEILDNTKSVESDLLSACQLADKVFNGDMTRGYDEKILLLFTDGAQQTRECDFLKENLDEKRIGEIIESEKQKGRLPDVRGVEVWMAGAGAIPQLSQGKLDQMQDFWLRYFKECGAGFSKERYATTLINFTLGEGGDVVIPARAVTEPTTVPPPQTSTSTPSKKKSIGIGEDVRGKATDSKRAGPPTANPRSSQKEDNGFGKLFVISNVDAAKCYVRPGDGHVQVYTVNGDNIIPLPAGGYTVWLTDSHGKSLASRRQVRIKKDGVTELVPDSE